ncbi:hypothetical protein [uncultured Jannaschia sp.]|uniref:hypothetical protein n=1 Tax=uncultured Jannaschia sp. TaxID=293347 RepID=UPI002602D6D7|nr:hypothetical protein [uncultured Jannaschia sp.]
MLTAVARGKAHRLFDKQKSELFGSVHRPQEDMVTSTIFDSMALLPMPDRRHAFDLVIGKDCLVASGFPDGADIDARLWHRFRNTPGRRSVEPDVLLTCENRVILVEVKWHAPLPKRQVTDEIAAAQGDGHNLCAVLLLGVAGDFEERSENTPPVFYRTWREVSADLKPNDQNDDSIDRWKRMVHGFLQKTDLGHIFSGIDTSNLFDPGSINYRYHHQIFFKKSVRSVDKSEFMFFQEE